MDDLAVVLLGGRRLAGVLGERLGCRVRTAQPDQLLETAGELGGTAELVVGVADVPWPVAEAQHALASATLEGYTGVVSWHALPALHDALAEVVAPVAANGAHLLVTAPDPGSGLEPEDAAFIRTVAEAVDARVAAPSSSIAWRGQTRQPTAVEALTTIVEAHGRYDVVECPIAPGTPRDADLDVAAERLGARLVCADLGTETLIRLLAEVVRTVAEHEGAT